MLFCVVTILADFSVCLIDTVYLLFSSQREKNLSNVSECICGLFSSSCLNFVVFCIFATTLNKNFQYEIIFPIYGRVYQRQQSTGLVAWSSIFDTYTHWCTKWNMCVHVNHTNLISKRIASIDRRSTRLWKLIQFGIPHCKLQPINISFENYKQKKNENRNH